MTDARLTLAETRLRALVGLGEGCLADVAERLNLTPGGLRRWCTRVRRADGYTGVDPRHVTPEIVESVLHVLRATIQREAEETARRAAARERARRERALGQKGLMVAKSGRPLAEWWRR